MSQDAGQAGRPLLRVVRGNPSTDELAALVVVLAARPPAGPPPAVRRTPGWRDRAALLRRPLHAGPGAWRASGLSR